MATGSTNFKNALNLEPVSADPSSPAEGDIQFSDGTVRAKGLWIYKDGAWSEAGSSGSGGINYLEGDNSNAENGVGDWVTYVDAPVAEIPLDGTGGSASITITQNTSSPLRDTADLLLTKGSLDTQGEGVSCDFTIDSADQAKKLTISFDYTTSANYADDDIKLFVYDVTNSNLIRVNGEDLKANSGNATHYAQFQTAPDSTSYRLIAHVSSTNASAYTINFDNIKVGPTNLAYGTIVTDWELTSLTTTDSGSVSSQQIYKRRVGDTVEYKGRVVFSGALTTDFVLTLDESPDSSNTPSEISGHAVYDDGGGNTNSGNIKLLNSGTTANFYFARLDVGNNNWFVLGNTYPTTISSGDEIRFDIKYKRDGWSSNAQTSEDLGNREIVVRASGNAGSSITSGVTDIDFLENEDTTASWDGDSFTAPKTGHYIVSGGIRANAAITSGSVVSAYIGGSSVKTLGESAGGNNMTFAGKVYLVKGEVLTIRINDTITLQNQTATHHIHISECTNPQTKLETETVAFKARSDNGITFSSGSDVVYEISDFDTHGNYNTSTGEYTIPVTGKYRISAKIATQGVAADAVTDSIGLDLHVNGSRVDSICKSEAQTTSTRVYFPSGSTNLDLTKGDVIKIVANEDFTNSISLAPNDDLNTFEAERIK